MTPVSDETSFTGLRLACSQQSRVRDLSGFRRTHQVPTEVNDHTNSFIRKIAVPELNEDIERWFADFRKHLKFRRLDMQTTDPHDGSAQISTPWFDYQIAVSLVDDDPAQVVWKRSLSSFRQPQKLLSPATDMLFGTLFNIVEMEPFPDLNLPQFIDDVEQLETSGISLDYDRNATWCHISLPGIAGQMRLSADEMSLVLAQPARPASLLESFAKFQQILSRANGSSADGLVPVDEL